jgi:hypothetical protein
MTISFALAAAVVATVGYGETTPTVRIITERPSHSCKKLTGEAGVALGTLF